MDYKEINNIPMFFIVGRARSGTTLLQTLLDAHPSIVIPSESCILIHLKNKYHKQSKWDSKTVNDFLVDILTEKKLRQTWKINYDKLKSEILEIPEKERCYVLICKVLYLNYSSLFQQQNVSLLGDKNPIYSIFIKDIIELFPEAKFIHIIRDYRANILSNREVFSLKNIASLAHAWNYHNKKIADAKKTYSHKFITLKYEDLVQKPENEMRRIFIFLNISYNSTIFEFYQAINKKPEPALRNRFKKVHGNLLMPVNNSKVESWKKDLTFSEIQLSDFICQPYAQQFGYSSTQSNSNSIILNIKSAYGAILNTLIIGVIRLFYYSPFTLKKLYSLTAKKINKWLKVNNYFNQTDVVN